MSRVNRAVAVATTLLVGAPAAGYAAVPVEGSWYNASQARGAYLVTSRSSVRTLWLFCRLPKYDSDPIRYPYRASRYELPDPLHVGRDGGFSYRGRGWRYGAEGQSLGRWKIRVVGRFTSPTRVRIRRTLGGCGGPAAITVRAERNG